AAILDHARVHGDDAAVVFDASLQINEGAGPSAMGPEHFLAGVGDLYRGARLTGCDGGDDLKRNDFALTAETAAHQRLDNADLGHGNFEHKRELMLQVVRHLRGRPYGKTAEIARLRI